MRAIALAPFLAPFLASKLLLAAAAPASSDERIHLAPPPAWVETVPVPGDVPARADQHANGIAYLLRDVQIGQRERGHDEFLRLSYRIVGRPGLESGARISFDFDPARHRVTLNRVAVLRDGVAIDQLDEVEPTVYRRETDAERGIFDGWLTASIDIRDVRVGDVIDHARTIEVRPHVDAGLFHERQQTGWSVPLSLLRVRIDWAADEPLFVQTELGAPEPAVSTAQGRTTYRWTVADPEPQRIEDDLPPGHPATPGIEVSSTKDWGDVVAVLLAHYRPAAELPPEFQGRLDRIAAETDDPARRMIAAMRLVQDDIRYVSLSMGEGSYVPRPPSTVVESGFGDCKDKSLLLVSALGRLGIEADAALTHTDHGPALPEMLPALGNFNHVIVKAVVDGVAYWIDPTDMLQGGRAEDFVEPDYGFALPIRPGSNRLEPLPSDPATTPSSTVEEAFDFPRADGLPLGLKVKSVYERADADWMRNRLAWRSPHGLAQDYLEYYARRYPGLRAVAPLAVADDREANRVTVEEAYELSWETLHADGLVNKFPLRAAISHDLPSPSVAERRSPIGIGKKRYLRHTVRVSNLKAEFEGPKKADVSTPFFLLRLLSRNRDGAFEIDWHFRTLMEEVPADAATRYVKAVRKLKNGLYWTYDFAYEDEAEPAGER